MITRLRTLLTDRRGSLPAVGLGFVALLALGTLAVGTYNAAAQTSASAHIRQLTLAVESRANQFAAQLDTNLTDPTSATTGRECSVNPGICTQILAVTPAADGASQVLRVQADAVDANTSITRDIVLKATQATHVTALDNVGRPTWVDTAEGHHFTIWGVSAGSITKVTPEQMQGPTAGTQWVLATPAGGIDNTGQLWVYGPNTKCQTGTGSTSTTPLAPTKLSIGTGIRTIVAGTGSTFYLDASGQAWAAGDNSRGQLGIGSTTNACTPTKIPDRRFITISSAGSTTFGIDTTGALYAWGNGADDQIGDGTGKSYTSPIRIAPTNTFTAVSTNGTSTLAVDTTGKVWGWGANSGGILAYGLANKPYPNPVALPGGMTFTTVAAGALTGYGIDAAGKLWAWGANTKGQIGDGTTTARTTPTAVATTSVISSVTPAGSGVYAVDQYGHVLAWGDNTGGALGLSSGTPITTPALLPDLRTRTTVQASIGTGVAVLDTDNVLWAIGTGTTGLWPATFDTPSGKPLRMPRPDGFTGPTWK